METKFGVQTLHSKYYLRIKPRCSGNFWSSKTKETALVKFLLDFSGTSQSHRAQASATVLSQDQVNPSTEVTKEELLKGLELLAIMETLHRLAVQLRLLVQQKRRTTTKTHLSRIPQDKVKEGIQKWPKTTITVLNTA